MGIGGQKQQKEHDETETISHAHWLILIQIWEKMTLGWVRSDQKSI